MGESKSFFHDYIRAGSPDTPMSELEKLGRSKSSRVRARVAENPMTPVATLKLLATDSNVDVKIAVATNGSTPRSIVWQIACGECVMTRLALAEDPSTPACVLEKLSCDENPYVAFEAGKTLQVINRDKSSAIHVPAFISDNVREFKGQLSTKVS